MGTANHERTPSTALRDSLFPAVEQTLRDSPRDDLPALCDEIGLPDCPYEKRFTKLKYIQARLAEVAGDDQIREVAANFVRRYPLGLQSNAATFKIEELLWQCGERRVPLWVRRKLAAGLVHADLFTDVDAFLEILGRLFVLDVEADFISKFIGDTRSFLEEIREDFIRNRLWSVKKLFHKLDAFTCTDKRFCRFIEALAGSRARPTEASQRFVAATNSALENTGFELVKTDEPGGYPGFSFKRLSDPKTPLYRFYDKWSEPYHMAVSFFGGFMTLCASLWFSVSIAYSLSTSIVAGTVAVLFIGLYLLSLYGVLKELRWWRVFRIAYLIPPLCIAIYKGITDASPSWWILSAALTIVALVLAFGERERETEPTAETFGEKFMFAFEEITVLSVILMIALVVLASVLGEEWYPIMLEFVQSPPYIKVVFPPDRLLD